MSNITIKWKFQFNELLYDIDPNYIDPTKADIDFSTFIGAALGNTVKGAFDALQSHNKQFVNYLFNKVIIQERFNSYMSFGLDAIPVVLHTEPEVVAWLKLMYSRLVHISHKYGAFALRTMTDAPQISRTRTTDDIRTIVKGNESDRTLTKTIDNDRTLTKTIDEDRTNTRTSGIDSTGSGTTNTKTAISPDNGGTIPPTSFQEWAINDNTATSSQDETTTDVEDKTGTNTDVETIDANDTDVENITGSENVTDTLGGSVVETEENDHKYNYEILIDLIERNHDIIIYAERELSSLWEYEEYEEVS